MTNPQSSTNTFLGQSLSTFNLEVQAITLTTEKYKQNDK